MKYIKRDIESDIFKWINEREIIAIRGPRQCGKTTLINKIRTTLIEKGVKNESIHYFDFEDNLLRIKFEENWREFIKSYLTQGKNYFLIDEIQNVKEIGKKLKLVFDSFNDIKLIITGSSSFDLTNLGKYLVGRVLFFDLLPFNFHEFLRSKGERYERLHEEIRVDMKDIKIKKTIFLDELNSLLYEYLTFGAYPRVILEEDKEKKKVLLKNIFNTYIEKDVSSVHKGKYKEGIIKLLKTLSSTIGGIIKYETLIETSGLNYKEIKEIIQILQDSYVISVVNPFHRNLVTELRKNPKIYFVDFGFRNYLMQNFDNLDFQFLYENFIYNELKPMHIVKYWRTTTKTEVDFVVENLNIIPIEVKTTAKITRATRSFMKTYNSKFGIIANLKAADNPEKLIYLIPFVYF